MCSSDLGVPDMRVPLQFALTYPQRQPSPAAFLDFTTLGSLSFGPVDLDRYPCLRLALRAACDGGTSRRPESGRVAVTPFCLRSAAQAARFSTRMASSAG